MLRSAWLALLCLLVVAWAPPVEATPGGPGPIPVQADDPSWGRATAPVTMVVFSDLQCPYCAKLHGTIDQLERRYGRGQLRVVFKHMPLPFHKEARPAAEAAVAVRALQGDPGFWRFTDQAFTTIQAGGGTYLDVLKALGISEARVKRVLDGGRPAKKVDEDVALARSLGVRGVPAAYINGVQVRGAQQIDELARIVDEQLAAARELRGKGVPMSRIYAELTKQNFSRVAPAPPPSAAAAPHPGPWRVPVGGSPSIGPASAPVTLVVFSDFQCPFCSRLVPTLETLRKEYGRDLRVVFKHRPLPFHKDARPAAQLSVEVFRRRGHDAFWVVHDALFAQQRRLSRADLERLAADLSLGSRTVERALTDPRNEAVIAADEALAAKVTASGTPTSFINGRKLSGARSVADFRQIIDEEIAHARQLQRQGIPASRVYSHIMKTAHEQP